MQHPSATLVKRRDHARFPHTNMFKVGRQNTIEKIDNGNTFAFLRLKMMWFVRRRQSMSAAVE